MWLAVCAAVHARRVSPRCRILSYNNLELIPDSIGSLSALRKLDVSGNALESIPSTVGSLCELEELDVSLNLIHSLPDSIGLLLNLGKLFLSHNRLESIPSTVGDLPALQELVVSHNKLKSLPATFGGLSKLRTLRAAHNWLECLPETIGDLPELCDIDASYNALTALPALRDRCSNPELRVSNNRITALPASIEQMGFKFLDVSNNFLSGPIAERVATLASKYGQTIILQPQLCHDGYFQVGGAVERGGGSFGNCVPYPVPSFKLYEMLPQVALQVRMASKDAAANSTLGVLALNVLGPGGIGDSWQTGGLNSSMRLECTADAPLACFGDGCATVWMQSDDCAVFNATHVRLTGKALSPAVAQLRISVAPQSLHEGLYLFALRVPVWNGSGWRFPSIDAQLEVRAVADAHQSEVRVEIESDPSRPEGGVLVANHLEALMVEIVARDINGVPIKRMGERIAVRFVGSDGASRTELAKFRLSFGTLLYARDHRSAWGARRALGYRCERPWS